MKTLTQTKLTGNPEIDKYLVQNYNLLDHVNDRDFLYEHMWRQFDDNNESFKRFVETEYPYNYENAVNKHYDTHANKYPDNTLYD